MSKPSVILAVAVLALVVACGDADPAAEPEALTTQPPPTETEEIAPTETEETAPTETEETAPIEADRTLPTAELWAADAVEYRGQVGMRVRYHCPPGGTIGVVWGTEIYTDDSSVCTAAVHAGLVTVDGGGDVVIEIRPGQNLYAPSDAHGVSSQPWGEWPGSFVFAE